MKRFLSQFFATILTVLFLLPVNAWAEDVWIHGQRGADIVVAGIGNYTTSTGKITRGATWAYQCGCAAYGAAITVGGCDGSTTAAESGTTGIYNLTIKAADFSNDHCIVALTSAALMGEHIYHLISKDAFNLLDIQSATAATPAVKLVGNTTAAGFDTTGGATSGPGTLSTGGAPNGIGFNNVGTGAGQGIKAFGGDEAVLFRGNGGAVGSGLRLVGYPVGLKIENAGSATGATVQVLGGGTGGDAVGISTTNGHSINFSTAGAGKVDINAPRGFAGSISGTIGGLTLGSLVASPVSTVDGSTVTIAATQATGSIKLKGVGNSQIILNAGSNTVFVALGSSTVTATTASTPIYPGSSLILPLGSNTYIAAICNTGQTATIYSTSAYTTAR